jgi:hypothetical protein
MRHARALLGYGILALGLPLALVGISIPPNEYDALGFAGLDCDGPASVGRVPWGGVAEVVIGDCRLGLGCEIHP